ncbi:MAG: hypothetical protein NZ851_03085 [Aquificaceae bacterium]|nr:hypothetical protein [Aquificaceae bacterium]
MRVLLLGGNEHSLELKAWLEEVGEEVIYTEEPIDPEMLNVINPEFIVSYNYRRITPEEVLRTYYPKKLSHILLTIQQKHTMYRDIV